LIDITQHLNDLNLKLMGKSQLVNTMFSHVKSFENKLSLWEHHLREGNTVHFPILTENSPHSTEAYADELNVLQKSFRERFLDFRANENLISVFATPFDFDAAKAPHDLQMELLEIQCMDDLKVKYNSMPLLEFYRTHVTSKNFPNLRKHAINLASLFGSTYLCEQFFSKMKHAKSNLRTTITDKNLSNQLHVATTIV